MRISDWSSDVCLPISDFANELLDGLDALEAWPEKVKLMQENWIGKSQGLRFRFRLAQPAAGFDGFEVFTTRPDTLYGASFAAIPPDHPLAGALARDHEELGGFIADCRANGTGGGDTETPGQKEA